MSETESNIPAEELIRSGELGGREALTALAETDKYVFHGSPTQIEGSLEPRQATNHGEDDGPIGIAATKNPDTAIFRALVHKDLQHHSGWFGDSTGQMTFLLTLATLKDVQESGREGTVYVLKDNDFTQFRGGEMRSEVSQAPEFRIPVTANDLPGNILVFETADELKAYQRQQYEAYLVSKQEQDDPEA